jgi:hypothetical protein
MYKNVSEYRIRTYTMQTNPRVPKFKVPDSLLQVPLPLLLPTFATALLKTDFLRMVSIHAALQILHLLHIPHPHLLSMHHQ